MRELVIDCSVTMGWCFTDESDAYALKVLGVLASRRAIVPMLWLSEVSHVLMQGERQKRIQQSDTMKFIQLLSVLPITFDSSWPRLSEITNLSRTFRLSGYDATYLELAMRTGAELATADHELKKATRAVGLDVFR